MRKTAIVLVVLVFVVYLNRSRYNWYETYEQNSKDPYGAHVISELLKTYHGKNSWKVLDKPFADTLKRFSPYRNANYVFIGSWPRYDSLELNALISFVGQGHTAFISSTRGT